MVRRSTAGARPEACASRRAAGRDGGIRALGGRAADEENGGPVFHRRVNAGEPRLLREAGEVPFVLFHVRAEAPPKFPRLRGRHRLAVDDDTQRTSPGVAWTSRLAHEAVSCAISCACTVTSTFR